MKKNELSLFRRSNIGMVFQDFNLLSSLTVKENIMVPLILDKKYEAMEGNIVNKLANMLDIDKILESYPNEISGGQQQRAAICRAIINNPKIIFADEPTGNLDSRSSEKVLSYFELLHKECDASILILILLLTYFSVVERPPRRRFSAINKIVRDVAILIRLIIGS